MLITGFVIFVTALFINNVGARAFGNNLAESVILLVLAKILLLNIVVIARQPTQEVDLAFKVYIAKITAKETTEWNAEHCI